MADLLDLKGPSLLSSSCKCFALRSLAEERERERGKKKDKSSLVNHLFQYLMSDVISTPYKQECVSQYDCVLFNYRTKNMCFKRKKMNKHENCNKLRSPFF